VSESNLAPSPALRDGELVLVVGNLTIDDVVLPTGVTRMGTLGGNSVHAATAVVTAGARAALVARRGDDFPDGALAALAEAGVDMRGLVEIAGPTVRNWVIYEEDGSRRWLYRTPGQRSEEVAPQPEDLAGSALGLAAVVHVAAMPLGHAERIVAHFRRLTPGAVFTLDTHESWGATEADRVLALARAVDLFVPSQEELAVLASTAEPTEGIQRLAAAGVASAVVKAGGAGAYLLEDGRITHVPPMNVRVVDSTGAGDAFCGGLAAGLARGLSARESVGLGTAVAGTAITGSGSLRLLQSVHDRAAIVAAGRRLAAAGTEVRPLAPPRPADSTAPPRPAGPSSPIGPANQAGPADPPGPAPPISPPGDDPRYDIDVMRREIMTIPDVVSEVLDDSEGRITALAKRLAARGIRHLWLTGCGDSAFAGLAAEQALRRHSPIPAHPVHALDLARYQVRKLPADSAVIAASFSGKAGRTIEAAVQAKRAGHHVIALTNAPSSDLARASAETLLLDVPTLGFSPGTSSYVAMLCTLLRLSAELAQMGGDGQTLIGELSRLPAQAETTLRQSADVAGRAASVLAPAPWVAFLGAGPNEGTARFGAAKLFEGPQVLGVATNIEEWAHEQYFVTSADDPVVLINSSGADHDRGLEILSELRFIGACPVVISDRPVPAPEAAGELVLPLATGVTEELSPVTACLPLALIGFHLARLKGKRSYNFGSEAAKDEHYQTIHRATIGEPA
jgi:sugar/nucleoside kinase (ribokinase family)/fructoselysine-6-P-deglycase FrlB-like protein